MPAEQRVRLELLRPDWPDLPVTALMSTRAGGVSAAPFDSLNLGRSVGDEAEAVRENRSRFVAALGAPPVWLHQVHGARVVRLTEADLAQPAQQADASICTVPGIACIVSVADCLPVLLASQDGRVVGAAHAGWRGLAAGVLEQTVSAMCASIDCVPNELSAWLGPCIGPRQFEVGADVLEAFGADPARFDAAHFVARPRADGSPRWLADLPQLARDRLARAGVQRVSGGRWCTVEDRSRFFSFRRDGRSGRMAAAIAIRRR